MSTLRIAVIGPESTGKSSLSEQLAAYYKTNWVPEYARTYLRQINRNYSIEDVIAIYKEQYRIEQLSIFKEHKMIFVDTEFIIAKVWCEHVFGSCPEYFEEMLKKHPYDYYLLTSPDIPWEYDPLRENPGKGEYFFEWYKSILESHKLNYGIVSGIGDERLQSAVRNLDQFIKSKK